MNERDEIERLVDEYGTEKACCGRFAVAAKIALMSAIDRVLAERDAKRERKAWMAVGSRGECRAVSRFKKHLWCPDRGSIIRVRIVKAEAKK